MNGDFQIIAWIVFFVMGVIGGFLARSRRVGRLEIECHRLRSLVTAQLREVNGLEKELWNERQRNRLRNPADDKIEGWLKDWEKGWRVPVKSDLVDHLDGLRFRIRGIRGLPDSKVFRLKKIDKMA